MQLFEDIMKWERSPVKRYWDRSPVKKYFLTYWVGYFWFILTLMFALMMPLLMRFVTSKYEYTFVNLISDGDLVIFSMVIITSLIIDNFMFEKDFSAFLYQENESESSVLKKRFLVFIFPLLMVMFCLIAYIGCINMSEKTTFYELDWFIVTIELATFLAIASYAALIKQMSWNKKNETKKKSFNPLINPRQER